MIFAVFFYLLFPFMAAAGSATVVKDIDTINSPSGFFNFTSPLNNTQVVAPANGVSLNQYILGVNVNPAASTTTANHTGVYSLLNYDGSNSGFSFGGNLIADSARFEHNGSGTVAYASVYDGSANFANAGTTTLFKGITMQTSVATGTAVTSYYGVSSTLNTTGGILNGTNMLDGSLFIDSGTTAFINGVQANITLAGTTANSQSTTGVNAIINYQDSVSDVNGIQGVTSGVNVSNTATTSGINNINAYLNTNDTAAVNGVNIVNSSMTMNDSSTTTGTNGFNANLQFLDSTDGGNSAAINLYARTAGTANLSSFNTITANPEFEGSSTIANYTGISLTPQIRQNAAVTNISGGYILPGLKGSATATNMLGLEVSPQVQNSALLTNDLTGIRVNPEASNTAGVSGATGITVNMDNVTLSTAAIAAGEQKVGLEINGAAVNANFPYTIPGSASFFQQHYLGGQAIVASGDPTAAFGFGTNLAQTVTLNDDWTLDGAGLGYVDVGFVGALNFASGKTMARWTGALGGAGNPGGAGTLTDAIMFRGAGILPQGGSLTVTNMYGFQVDPALFCLVGTNCWGFYEDTAAAENHLSKLAIGTATKKVANSDTAFEIGNKKGLVVGRGTTTEKNALTAIAGMMFYDTTLSQLQWYDGSSWQAAAGGGSPGGADTNVQFNDAGAFAGESTFTYDKTNNRLFAEEITSNGGGSGSNSERFGASVDGTGPRQTILGYGIIAGSCDGCTIIGRDAQVGGAYVAPNDALTIGNQARVWGSVTGGIAIGTSSESKDGSVAIGRNSLANTSSFALGTAATAQDTTVGFNIAIGTAATITGTANTNLLIAASNGSISSGANQAVFGSESTPYNNFYLGEGITSTTPSATTLQVSGGSGTDIAGGDFNIAGSKGTGNAAPGLINFQTSTAGSSGTTLQSLTTRARVVDAFQVAEVSGGASTPSSGYMAIYAKTDGNLYAKNDSGTEYNLSVPGSATDAQEVPSGTVDNSNVTFTLANTPTSNASVKLFQDGLILIQGTDYTISGVTITMTVAPNFGQTLYAAYTY